MTDPDLFLQPVRSPRADAIKNRMLLLETARQLFGAQGVDAVPMSAIAEAAGVGKGTLYRHFPDKAALCHALLDQQMTELQNNTLAHLRGPGAPLEKLHWFLDVVLHFVDRNTEMLREAAAISPLPTLAHPAHLWWRQTIIGLLEQHAPGDWEYAADVLYIMLDVQTLIFQQYDRGLGLEQIAAGLHNTLNRLAG